MLECAARCLDSGSRPALRQSTKSIIHSRRCLHQTFWHHGAGDLSLPAWYFASMRALFEPPTSDSISISSHSAFLDFLYPPKTRLYLRRLFRESNTANISTRRSRRFTSIAQHAFATRSTTATALLDEVALASADSEELRHWQALEQHLKRHRQGFIDIPFDDAWKAYEHLPSKSNNIPFIQQLIDLFASSDRTVDASRVQQLFDTIPTNKRTGHIYDLVIGAYIRLQDFDKAVTLYDEFITLDNIQLDGQEPTKRLLNELLDKGHWQLALHVWKAFFAYTRTAMTFDFPQWRRSTFADLSKLPQYPDKVATMVSFFKTDAVSLSQDFAFREFIFAAINAVYDNGLGFGSHTTESLLKSAALLGLKRSFWNDMSILNAIKYPLDAQQRFNYALTYLELYRKDKSMYRPQKPVLSSLILLAIECGELTAVRDLWDDWRRIHGTSISIGLRVSMMSFFAKRGDVREVERLFQERPESQAMPNQRLMYPLLRVQAEIYGPEAVKQKMKSLEHDFNLQSDLTCLNILLHSYVKTADYDGAMDSFQTILDKGLKPDNMTTGIMMTLCAQRGDVTLVQEFMSYNSEKSAKEVDFGNEMLVQALIKNGDVETAQRWALEGTTNSSKESRTRIWNSILAAYAIHGQIGPILRVSQHMRRLQIALDSLSYAAFMRVYVVRRDITKAQSIFNYLISHKTLRPLAFHYALMIEGYVKEYQFESAYRIHADMLTRNVEPTVSTRAALLRLQIAADRIEYERSSVGRKQSNLPIQLERAEELLEELIIEERHRSPVSETTLMSTFTPWSPRVSAYFDALVSEYGSKQAYDAVERLLQRYEQVTGSSRSASIHKQEEPLNVILSLMEIRLAEEKHDEIDGLWQLALMTGQRLMRSRPTSEESVTIPSRRTLLSRHLDRYIKSLEARGKHAEVLAVYEKMAQQGLTLDYLNMNKYIEVLISQRKAVEAFKYCEDHLIRGFTAWHQVSTQGRMNYMVATGRREKGLEHLRRSARRFDASIPRVTVRTIQLFAKVLRELKAGLRYDRSSQRLLNELMQVAPKTVAVTQSMPRNLQLPT